MTEMMHLRCVGHIPNVGCGKDAVAGEKAGPHGTALSLCTRGGDNKAATVG